MLAAKEVQEAELVIWWKNDVICLWDWSRNGESDDRNMRWLGRFREECAGCLPTRPQSRAHWGRGSCSLLLVPKTARVSSSACASCKAPADSGVLILSFAFGSFAGLSFFLSTLLVALGLLAWAFVSSFALEGPLLSSVVRGWLGPDEWLKKSGEHVSAEHYLVQRVIPIGSSFMESKNFPEAFPVCLFCLLPSWLSQIAVVRLLGVP